MNFDIIILGSDANAYYMARCYHELTNRKANLIGKTKLAFTKFSNILEINYEPDIWKEEKFVSIINNLANKLSAENVLLVSTNETYTEFIAKYYNDLDSKLHFNKIDLALLKTLTNKEEFYKTYKKSVLTFPETFYYDCKKSSILPSTLTYPIIVKPANVVMFNHLNFDGKKKIYKLETEKELEDTITAIKKGSYTDRLIIQEYIPGGDDHLFDSVVYVDRNHKVSLITFAQIGLQERTKTMVGNAAVLINGFSTFDVDTSEMKKNIISFMETIQYHGFAEIDMKYDARDKTFKVLEINARQGRSSYYVSALGKNLIDVMVKDLIKKEDEILTDLDKEQLLTFVPKGIIKKYIDNPEFKKKAMQLWKKKRVMPMIYENDRNLKRFLMTRRRLWNYYKEYKNSDWRS